MSDGSVVVYKLSVESGTGQYLEDRSRTKDGQVTPEENSPEYQGTWTGDGDIRDLKEYLEGLGATFTQTGNGYIMQTMKCTWVPRSEERRDGKEVVSTGRSGWWPSH